MIKDDNNNKSKHKKDLMVKKVLELGFERDVCELALKSVKYESVEKAV
jgi:hypothetical protein